MSQSGMLQEMRWRDGWITCSAWMLLWFRNLHQDVHCLKTVICILLAFHDGVIFFIFKMYNLAYLVCVAISDRTSNLHGIYVLVQALIILECNRNCYNPFCALITCSFSSCRTCMTHTARKAPLIRVAWIRCNFTSCMHLTSHTTQKVPSRQFCSQFFKVSLMRCLSSGTSRTTGKGPLPTLRRCNQVMFFASFTQTYHIHHMN